MTTAWITALDKTRIAYHVEGQGPALMLLHGAGKTRRDWYKQGYVALLRDDLQSSRSICVAQVIVNIWWKLMITISRRSARMAGLLSSDAYLAQGGS